MKNLLKPSNLPWFALGAGILGALLRLWLYTTGTDDRGMLVSSHPGDILSWILTMIVAAVILIGCYKLIEGPKYSFNFPANAVSAVGAYAAGAGVFITSVAELFSQPDTLAITGAILGFLAALALVFLGQCRRNGQHPVMIFHSVVCIYLMIHLVCLYRLWSSDPQIQDYCFQLLASVCLMVSCYQRATFDANFGTRRSYTVFRLASVYFCILCLPSCTSPVFYLTMGAWALTDMCNLTPMRNHRR